MKISQITYIVYVNYIEYVKIEFITISYIVNYSTISTNKSVYIFSFHFLWFKGSFKKCFNKENIFLIFFARTNIQTIVSPSYHKHKQIDKTAYEFKMMCIKQMYIKYIHHTHTKN